MIRFSFVPGKLNNPFKEEYRLAVKEKKNVNSVSWRLREIEHGVSVLEGKEVGFDLLEVYTYRFDKTKFTLGTARLWLKAKGIEEVKRNLFVSMSQFMGESLKRS